MIHPADWVALALMRARLLMLLTTAALPIAVGCATTPTRALHRPVTPYSIHIENVSTSELLDLTERVEATRGFVQSLGVEGGGRRFEYRFTSRASSLETYRAVYDIVHSMRELPEGAQVTASGNEIAVKVIRSAAGEAQHDIHVLVLVNDGARHSVDRRNGIVRAALVELEDRMAHCGFGVTTVEMFAAVFQWDLSGRYDTTELLKQAYAAIDAAQVLSRPELSPRALVIFSVLGTTHDERFGTQVRVEIDGAIHDAVAKRFLSRVGPETRTFVAPPGCGSLCLQEVARPLASAVASIVGDEASRELAALAGGQCAHAQPVSRRSQARLTTPYTLHFENFSTVEVLELIHVVENEFPLLESSRSIEGSPPRMIYGFVSSASDVEMHKWLNQLLFDMDLEPDTRVEVRKDGTRFRLEKLRGARSR